MFVLCYGSGNAGGETLALLCVRSKAAERQKVCSGLRAESSSQRLRLVSNSRIFETQLFLFSSSRWSQDFFSFLKCAVATGANLFITPRRGSRPHLHVSVFEWLMHACWRQWIQFGFKTRSQWSAISFYNEISCSDTNESKSWPLTCPIHLRWTRMLMNTSSVLSAMHVVSKLWGKPSPSLMAAL